MKINRIVKLKLVDARLYFVSLIVGLLDRIGGGSLPLSAATILQYAEELLSSLRLPGITISSYSLPYGVILCFVARMARRWPYIGGGGISQTRGRYQWTHRVCTFLSPTAG
ncbi:MAG: hypothetical protein ACLR6J_14255 [Parabacteroides merdae]